jgi:hypothetical protein
MRFYLGAAVRFFGPMLAGGGLAVLVAANWPDPNDETAGALLGLGGVVGGGILGMLWAFTWAERHDEKRR